MIRQNGSTLLYVDSKCETYLHLEDSLPSPDLDEDVFLLYIPNRFFLPGLDRARTYTQLSNIFSNYPDASILVTSGRLPFLLGKEQIQDVTVIWDPKYGPNTIQSWPIQFPGPGPFVIRYRANARGLSSGKSLTLGGTLNSFFEGGNSVAYLAPELFTVTSRILPKKCKPASNKALRLPSRATSLTIVTRTKGNRNEFLIQNANSVSAFETNLPISCTLGHLIIGEVTQTPDVVTANKVNFQSPEGKDSDDRFALIKEALKICESEYIWFVDDDDLVNPDAAVEIATMLSLGNADIVQIDSQHFIGDLKQQGHRYRAKNFEASFMAPNQTPLCSIIYRTKFLKELISEKFNEITLLEDHFMYMIALASTASPVVSSPIIGSNIRLHENNSVVVRDTKQYSHASDLYKLWEGMVRIRFNQQLLISAQYYRKNIANQTPFIANLLRAVFSREAWRSVFYFKVLQRLIAKEISVRQLGIWLRRRG